MQVAIPYLHLTDPAGSNPVACSCVFSQNTENILVNILASLCPSTTASVSVSCTPLGYRALKNVMFLALFVQSWAMLYVNNSVMLGIVVHTSSTTTLIQKNKARCLLMVKACDKETEKRIVFPCVWSNSAVVNSYSLQPAALPS
jgi:hypothetical protein